MIKDTKNLPKLTKKQAEFLKVYKETGNATEAAARAYDVKDRSVASSIGTENLNKPAIRVYKEEWEEQAKQIVYNLAITAENETVRLNAAKDILDRNVGKSKQSVDVTSDNKPIQLVNYSDLCVSHSTSPQQK